MAVVKLTTTQVKDLVNDATKQTLGEEAIQIEDLSNVVDMGTAIANANLYENFIYNLLVATAKIIFVERKYSGKAPNVYRDNFEYGQIVQKIRAKLDEAEDNQSWQLTNGASYDDNVFVAGTVQAKIFASSTAFEVRKSITNDQIKNAFTSAQELGNFLSMIVTMIENSLQLKMDSLIMMTINNFAAEVAHNNNATTYVNLLSSYNTLKGTQLTAVNCIYDRGFLQYATGIIKKYQGKLENYSTLFNMTGTQTFTPKDKQHLVLLQEFADNCDTYLASDTWHNEFVSLPYHETVSAWQGQGTASSLADCSKIMVKTAAGNSVTMTGVLAVLFDHDALGVTQENPSVETKYIRSAQFTNWWYKKKTSYFNDLDENFVVFYVA